jgi:hypothetical protein
VAVQAVVVVQALAVAVAAARELQVKATTVVQVIQMELQQTEALVVVEAQGPQVTMVDFKLAVLEVMEPHHLIQVPQ